MNNAIQPIAATVDALKRQLDDQSIIWIGAGASIPAGYPSAPKLISLMKEASDDPIDSEDFPTVADDFVKSRGPGALRMLLQRVIGRPGPLTPFHRAVAALAASGRIHTIITTNYDDLVERALAEAQVPYIVQMLQKNFDAVPPQTVRVIKVHGSMQDWETVILSGDSYARFDEEYALLSKQLDILCTQYPLTFVGSSLCEPRVLSWLAKRTETERARMMPWRAILTFDEWNRLLSFEWQGVQAQNILQGQFRPLLVNAHDDIPRLWSELAQRLVPPPVVESADAVPKITLDWPNFEPPHEELDAFLAEASYRAARNQKPWFQISLSSLEAYKAALSEIEGRGTPTSEDRKKRIECLKNIEHLEQKRKNLSQCLELILSDALRKSVGWWIVPTDKMVLVVTELLAEPSKERSVRALLVNHRAQMQADLYMERERLEELFECSLPVDRNFLSITDCPVPIDLAEADWETQWRALGVILRKAVIQNIDAVNNVEAIQKANWIISGD